MNFFKNLFKPVVVKKEPTVLMDRIIIHWSAGNGKVNSLEKKHYHFIVDAKGDVYQGNHKVEDNIPPVKSGGYAAHTLNLNGSSIGVAISAMAGATERPFSWGTHPMTETQVDALCRLVASLSTQYGVPVTRKTILTHAEVQPTLGIKQRFKWDITVLPGMKKPMDPVVVGDILRERIKKELR